MYKPTFSIATAFCQQVTPGVVSTFFPNWLDGAPISGGFASVPGDGADGYAREDVTAPATAFTHQPRGYPHAEAATLTCADRSHHSDRFFKAFPLFFSCCYLVFSWLDA